MFLDTSGGTVSVVNAPDTLTATGLFSGPGALTVNGTGTLALTNTANIYDGGTIILDGTLRIAADSALGTATRTLTFDQGIGTTPTLNTIANINMSRPVHLNNSAIFDVSTGTTLTLGGVIDGNLIFGFNKIGAGTLVLNGFNNFPGYTIVLDGLMQLDNLGSDAAITGTLIVGDSIVAGNSAIVQLLRNNQIINNTYVEVFSNGLFDVNGFSESIGGLTINGGNVAIGTGS